MGEDGDLPPFHPMLLSPQLPTTLTSFCFLSSKLLLLLVLLTHISNKPVQGTRDTLHCTWCPGPQIRFLTPTARFTS